MLKKSESGLTLVEVIVSIAILSIIVIAFLPMFTMSAKSNSRSKSSLNSTYMGKNDMELIYHYINENKSDDTYSKFYEKLKDELMKNETGKKAYNYNTSEDFFEYEDSNGKYSKIKMKEEGNLVRVTVKVYANKVDAENPNDKKEAQYESIYPWKKRGD